MTHLGSYSRTGSQVDTDDHQPESYSSDSSYPQPRQLEVFSQDAPQKSVSNKKPLIFGAISAAVIVIAAVVGLALFLKSEDSTGSPKEALELYVEAARNNDRDAAQAVACEPFDKDITGDSEFKGNFEILQEKKISDDEYSYDVEYTPEDADPVRDNVRVIKEDGDWVVCPVRYVK